MGKVRTKKDQSKRLKGIRRVKERRKCDERQENVLFLWKKRECIVALKRRECKGEKKAKKGEVI